MQIQRERGTVFVEMTIRLTNIEEGIMTDDQRNLNETSSNDIYCD